MDSVIRDRENFCLLNSNMSQQSEFSTALSKLTGWKNPLSEDSTDRFHNLKTLLNCPPGRYGFTSHMYQLFSMVSGNYNEWAPLWKITGIFYTNVALFGLFKYLISKYPWIFLSSRKKFFWSIGIASIVNAGNGYYHELTTPDQRRNIEAAIATELVKFTQEHISERKISYQIVDPKVLLFFFVSAFQQNLLSDEPTDVTKLSPNLDELLSGIITQIKSFLDSKSRPVPRKSTDRLNVEVGDTE